MPDPIPDWFPFRADGVYLPDGSAGPAGHSGDLWQRPRRSATLLGEQVSRLRSAGAAVVVGTCPVLRPALGSVLRVWGGEVLPSSIGGVGGPTGVLSFR